MYDFHSDKVKVVHALVFLENSFPYQKHPTETAFKDEDENMGEKKTMTTRNHDHTHQTTVTMMRMK